MGRQWEKFVLLMWKNALLQYRKPLQTFLEIIAPVLFSILLVVIRSLVDPEENAGRHYSAFCPVQIPMLCADVPNVTANSHADDRFFGLVRQGGGGIAYLKELELVYSPTGNADITRSMGIFGDIFNKVTGYESAKELEDHFLTSDTINTTFAAIQFADALGKRADLPDSTEVSIRFPGELRSSASVLGQNNWQTNMLFPVYQTPGPRSPNKTFGAAPEYYVEGFLTLQTILTYFLIYGQKGATNLITLMQKAQEEPPVMIKMQRFPYGTWVEDPLLQALESFVGIIIMLSFVYTCINTVKVITTEKEKQLKEAMKIMGLPNWLHWTAWFLKTFVFLLISIVLIVILLKVTWYPNTSYSVFTYANPVVMLLFLFLYMCSTITFCFAISVFFSKANTAATIAGLLWFLSYSPYLFLQNQYATLSLSTKMLSSLGANTAMAFGFQLMLMYEGTSEGIQWNNIWKSNTPDDDLTLGLVMVMLVIDTLLYLTIALYVEAVFPGEFGVPQPWYFPFTATYWCGTPRNSPVEDFASIPANDSEFFERDPEGYHAGIQIRNLRKVFGGKAAVRNLSLNMYEDQITVLLGHNGAGKTTTMSMLTGMFPPTGGTAIVSGHDIRTDMDGVRASLGLCPQHNILFDDLTVREHLYFFSKLKGLEKKDIKKEIDNYIELLELVPKANAKSSTLSGGMKRKLCVGMALCGNSKVVMLDEPTAGMDPSARRALWDLIQKQKEGRSILLTTHFMDEADLLGDRIAIMAGGELQCCGSSFFLKKKYGAGYHLIMEKSAQCDAGKVTALLRKHIPNIEIHSNIGSELTYLLVENKASVFESMLKELEENSDDLGVRSYGISLTTLEEVFMKVGADHGQEEAYNDVTRNGYVNKITDWLKSRLSGYNSVQEMGSRPQEVKLTMGSGELLTGWQLILNQFHAMFMKKSLSTIRTWILQLIQLLMPVAFLIIAIVVSRNQNNTGDLPKLPLTLNSYDDPVTLVEKTTESKATPLMDTYIKLLKGGKHKVSVVDNIPDTMVNYTNRVPSTVRMRYMIGASFEGPEAVGPGVMSPLSTIIAWFNNDPLHTPPLALGTALNTAYNHMFDGKKTIRFANYPLPFTADTKIQQLLQGNSMGFQLAFNIGFSMAFVSSFYVLFYVRERVCKSKHLQFVSGVKVYVFWITSFLCDLATFIVTSLAIILTLVCFQEDGFRSAEDLGRVFLILLYFGCSMIPMMYFASYLFDVPSTGYTRMTLFSVFTGVAAFMVVQVLGTEGLDLEDVAHSLHWLFLIIPHYSLATGIRDTYMTYATNKMCTYFVEVCSSRPDFNSKICWDMACSQPDLSDYCCVKGQDYFKWESPGIGRNLFYSFIIGGVLFLLLLLTEYKFFTHIYRKIMKRYRTRLPQAVADEDSDVAEEKRKIHETAELQLQNDYTMVLKDVTKYYKNFLAVNGLNLGIKRYECFGLLGVNGAGKTTTFKMMTGDVKMTYGEAWVNKYSINQELKDVQKLIGYCPQFDALLDDLTAKESLMMFSLLRGVPRHECIYIAKKLAQDFDFTRHLNKQVKELSGGNKRKLSTAISLIGDPPVIYLDEPTTGMDPATKRYLWNALCQVRDNGKCIVLTSHSMEECEALCTRLAIMVNGNFKCLGSTQHLKNKFAEGYTLTIKIKKTGNRTGDHAGDHPENLETEAVERFIMHHFPRAVLREKHQELLTFYIIDKSTPWSKMFGILERGKQELNIEDYSLGQSSLEQVFLTFTKHQLQT